MIGAIGYGGASALWRQMQYTAGLTRGAAVAPAAAAEQEGAQPVQMAAAVVPAAASATFGPSELPYVPEGFGPEELANRARVRFPDFGTPFSNALEGKLAGLENKEEQENVPGVKDAKSAAEVAEDAKCETCEKRKYQDGSDDPGVSFKTAQKVDPKTAAAAVRGHEQEHVVRERAKAEREGRKVVSQSVTYHTGICPECGKFYVSGGTTRTVTAADNSKSPVETAQENRDEDAGLDVTA